MLVMDSWLGGKIDHNLQGQSTVVITASTVMARPGMLRRSSADVISGRQGELCCITVCLRTTSWVR